MTSEISAKNFYGGTKYLPPALVPSKGQKVALQSARLEEQRSFRIFPSQQQAFTHCDANPGRNLRIWAFEIDGKGRRRYVVASYDSFWRWYRRFIRRASILHFYEVIRERHACKLYFDLEYPIRFNPEAAPESMVDAVVSVAAELAGIGGLRRGSDSMVEMDSTTEKKFSRHLIMDGIAFHDNVQAGDFATRVVEAIAGRDEKLVMVRNSDGQLVPFVDLAVYTKNRCFRLVGSSKFGKAQRLLPLDMESSDRISFSEQLFLRSLVCRVSEGVRLLGSVSKISESAFPTAVRYRQSNSQQGHEGCQISEGSGKFESVDQYVLSIVEPHNGGIYGITYFSGSETVMYTIKGGYKFCANIGRHHKSNNVILVADLCSRLMYQRCFDPDCRTFRSCPWALPAGLFAEAEMEGSCIDEDISDSALAEMMDNVEGMSNCDGGDVMDWDRVEISDDALNVLMDDFEHRSNEISGCGREGE